MRYLTPLLLATVSVSFTACAGASPPGRQPPSALPAIAAAKPAAAARDEGAAPDRLHLAPLLELARAAAPSARTAVVVMLSPDDETRALAVDAAERAGLETDAIELDAGALTTAGLDVRVAALRAAGGGRTRDVVIVLEPARARHRGEWLELPWAALASGGGVVVARWVEARPSADARGRDFGKAKVFARPLGAGRVEHHAIVSASLGSIPVADAPRLGLMPLERGIDRDDRGASVSGYLVRGADGGIVIASPAAQAGRTTVRLLGPKVDALARRIDGTRFPLAKSADGPDDLASSRTTMIAAMGGLEPGSQSTTGPVSPVVARVKGALRLKEWSEAGRLYELDVEEIVHAVDLAGWQRANERYDRALARATAAFQRDDPKAAARALDEARAAIASEFLALAPSLEIYRFIDGLALRFDEAARAIERGEGGVVGYADAVLPLGLVRTMTGRPRPSPAEREAVRAAYRFARRAVMRELKAGKGNRTVLGRAIFDMASKVPEHDREMIHWVMENVPGAKMGFPADAPIAPSSSAGERAPAP